MTEYHVTVNSVVFATEADSEAEAIQQIEEKLFDIAHDWGALST